MESRGNEPTQSFFIFILYGSSYSLPSNPYLLTFSSGKIHLRVKCHYPGCDLWDIQHEAGDFLHSRKHSDSQMKVPLGIRECLRYFTSSVLGYKGYRQKFNTLRPPHWVN